MNKTPELGQKAYHVRDSKKTVFTVKSLEHLSQGKVTCSYFCDTSKREIERVFNVEDLNFRVIEFGW